VTSAVSTVLDLAAKVPSRPERRTTSGPVEQQALFAEARRSKRLERLLGGGC
jgi:hypothetical protein